MLKFNELKQNRAITLVALILTIIVMLILVGVSVSVLINSDLIGTAKNAGERTETAYGEEGQMGQITVGNKTYASIDDYLAGKEIKEWVTVYEGNATTTEGQVFLSEEVLFSDIADYRITVIRDEFIETIETTGVEFLGQGIHSLCATLNGEFIGGIEAFHIDTELLSNVMRRTSR